MSRGVNKVILVGNLGKDPECRYVNNKLTASITLATSETWRDSQTGEQKERTEWHRVVFWSPLAEIMRDHTRKGSKIFIEGSLRTRKWKDQSGNDHYITEIIARELELISSPGHQQPRSESDYFQQEMIDAHNHSAGWQSSELNDNGTRKSFAGNYGPRR